MCVPSCGNQSTKRSQPLIDDLAGGVLKGIVRFIIDIVFELILRGTGYKICELFLRQEVDPEGWVAAIVGLAFWAAVGFLVFMMFS